MNRSTKNVSLKVEEKAWDEAHRLAREYGITLCDAVSISLLHWGESSNSLTCRFEERSLESARNSESVSKLVKQIDKLTPGERAAIKSAL